jgi:hypothetical protein
LDLIGHHVEKIANGLFRLVDERHLVGHQAGDEMHVATQTVELAHCDCGPVLAGGDNGGSELWSAIRRVGLAGLHLDELGYHLAPFAGGKAGDGVVLCGKFQPALALPRPGNPNVGN